MPEPFERGQQRRWQSTKTEDWEIGRKGSDHWVTIPAGREFESSVPWLARWLTDNQGAAASNIKR